MTVFVCLDDISGMTFGGRRQSRDSRVIADVFAECGSKPLFISPFSEKLMSESGSVRVKRNPLSAAGTGDFCFIEDRGISRHLKKIKKLVIYHWNERYPTDFSFDTDPLAAGFTLRESIDFVGTSHDKITKEIYVK